jgi:CelD/BcsL family acetyltransferase involved in cellulose biosynthesis
VSVYQLDPLNDPRWQAFVDHHPGGSIFHSADWLEALCRTYGYEPVVYTTTPPGRNLANGLVFCRVRSWLSGSRLVSLPFSDHCQPLVDNPASLVTLLNWLKESQRRERWKYIELRPLYFDDSTFESDRSLAKVESYALHILDLRPDLDTLFRKFHKSCIQRKIQRAERERLTYEEGRSEALLRKFYSLLILTRRRQGIPPQPLAWFRNALSCLKDQAVIRVASNGDQPAASIITIAYKDVLVYKYGCSDARFNNLGGTSLLFWKAIQDAKQNGAAKFDLGRSELTNSGLISFKENWGAVRVPLDYYRLPAPQQSHPNAAWHNRFAKGVFSMMPDALLTATGKLLYRHIG